MVTGRIEPCIIDDIFVIWIEGPEKLKIFVDYLTNLHSTIKFTCSHSPTNIPFLDVMVSIKDGFIETDLSTKPTDKHQYLLISSCHPQHTKRSIPYSLALRLRRICSNHDNYIITLLDAATTKPFSKPKYRGLLTFLALTHLYAAVFFSRRERCHMYTKLILDLPVGIFVPVEYQLHTTVCPKHRDAYGIRWRTSRA